MDNPDSGGEEKPSKSAAFFGHFLFNQDGKDLKPSLNGDSQIDSKENLQLEPSRRISETTSDCKSSISDLCRFCALSLPGCISIFSPAGLKLKLAEKISCSLPLAVDESDKLPNTVCLGCVDQLESCYKFIQQAWKAYEDLLLRVETAELDIGGECQTIIKVEPEDPESSESEDEEWLIRPPKKNVRGVKKKKLKGHSAKSVTKQETGDSFSKGPKNTEIITNVALTSCSQCGAQHANNRENQAHWQSHHPGVPVEYACQQETCAFKTIHLSEIKDHLKEHLFQDGRIGQCEICAKFFPDRQMKRHMSTVHAERAFACSGCDRRFKSQRMLRAHERQHAPPGEKYRFSCEKCGKQFVQQSSLDLHLKRHQERKPHKCEDCSKSFYSEQDFKYHKFTHTGERPFQCDQCDHSFIRNGDLGKHIRIKHLNQLRFQCSFCPVKYNRQDQLRAHELGHTGELPFRCEACGRGFTRKHKLQSHLTVHLPEEERYRYPCPLCGKRFTMRCNLKAHLKSSAHGESRR